MIPHKYILSGALTLCCTLGVVLAQSEVLQPFRHALSGDTGESFHTQHGWKNFGTESNAGKVSFSK
jgi:hypothetical protein